MTLAEYILQLFLKEMAVTPAPGAGSILDQAIPPWATPNCGSRPITGHLAIHRGAAAAEGLAASPKRHPDVGPTKSSA
jgi:hypothetical protein